VKQHKPLSYTVCGAISPQSCISYHVAGRTLTNLTWPVIFDHHGLTWPMSLVNHGLTWPVSSVHLDLTWPVSLVDHSVT